MQRRIDTIVLFRLGFAVEIPLWLTLISMIARLFSSLSMRKKSINVQSRVFLIAQTTTLKLISMNDANAKVSWICWELYNCIAYISYIYVYQFGELKASEYVILCITFTHITENNLICMRIMQSVQTRFAYAATVNNLLILKNITKVLADVLERSFLMRFYFSFILLYFVFCLATLFKLNTYELEQFQLIVLLDNVFRNCAKWLCWQRFHPILGRVISCSGEVTLVFVHIDQQA